MNNELEQWCEIDGHSWVYFILEHGLFMSPKSIEETKICTFCKASEYKVYKPVESKRS